MSLPKHLGFLFALLLVTAGVQASDRADPAYLDELLRQAVELRLSDAREWHLLLHYRENLWKGFTSEADGPAFFLASNGKTDPAAELEATHAAKSTGVEALEHGSMGARDAKHASRRQNVSAAAVGSLPGREILVAFDREYREREIAQDLFETAVDLHAFGRPEIGIAAVVRHVAAETDQEIIAFHALIILRSEEGDVMDADVLDP